MDNEMTTSSDEIEKELERTRRDLDRASHDVRERVEERFGGIVELRDRLYERVRAEPLKAVGIAFAGGFLIGRLF